MFQNPTSSPQITTMFGYGDLGGVCACADPANQSKMADTINNPRLKARDRQLRICALPWGMFLPLALNSIAQVGFASRSKGVRLWHKADMLNALTNVRFWGQGGHGPTLLTNLDL